MAEKDLEGDDPMEFVATRFPAPPGVDMDEAMARTFIEEYAVMGMPRDRVLAVFRSPSFVGAHAIYASRGPAFVERIANEVYGHARPRKPCRNCGHRDAHYAVLVHYDHGSSEVQRRLRCPHRDPFDRLCTCDLAVTSDEELEAL